MTLLQHLKVLVLENAVVMLHVHLSHSGIWHIPNQRPLFS
jgi:hypothetical protein